MRDEDSPEGSPLSQCCLLSVLLSQAGSWVLVLLPKHSLPWAMASYLIFFSFWMGLLILFEAWQSCNQKLRQGVLDLLPDLTGV